MLKEKIRESKDSLSQHQPKWRNIVFDKNGNSYLGISLWDTKEGAANRMSESKAINLEKEAKGIVTGYSVVGGILYTRDYAWHMQVPVL